VIVDLLMSTTALMLGALLAAFSGRLATLMREGDDRWREQAWTQSFEPDVGFLASDRGRWWIFRCWLLLSSVGFFVIGAGLGGRALL
jgi:hypothetical protein